MKQFILLALIILSTKLLVAQSFASNPYDYVGVKHNAALDSTINNFSSDHDYSTEIKENVLDNLSIGNNGEIRDFFEQTIAIYNNIHSSLDQDTLYINYGFSTSFCDNATFIVNLYNNKTDNQQFYDSIIVKENEILNSNTLSATEKGILLSSASTIRYSNVYWSNSGNIEKWSALSPPNEEQRPPSFWGHVGAQDLNGAIQGGVAGAIIGGTVSLGTLAVPGWVAGAVSWGAGSSVAAGVGWLTGWW